MPSLQSKSNFSFTLRKYPNQFQACSQSKSLHLSIESILTSAKFAAKLKLYISLESILTSASLRLGCQINWCLSKFIQNSLYWRSQCKANVEIRVSRVQRRGVHSQTLDREQRAGGVPYMPTDYININSGTSIVPVYGQESTLTWPEYRRLLFVAPQLCILTTVLKVV